MILQRSEFRYSAFFLTTALFLAAAGHGAPVAPNPNSLLKGKRVMFLTGAASDHHLVPRQNAVANAKRIKAVAGMASLTLIDKPDNLTFADLDTIDIIVCSYVSKIDTLIGKPFEKAFKKWIASGHRGWVGMHNTGANSEGQWDWFRDSVAAMRYREHKDAAQQGTVKMSPDPAVRALPVLQGLDAQFTVADEWYSFDLPPKAPAPPAWAQAKVLYTLDESKVKLSDPMGTHPVAWIREDALQNRFFYTLLVHSDEGSATDFYQSLILRGMEYAAGYKDPTGLAARRTEGAQGIQGAGSEAGATTDALGIVTAGTGPSGGAWRWCELFRGRIFPSAPRCLNPRSR